jgi:seryl-tRNA synthetase
MFRFSRVPILAPVKRVGANAITTRLVNFKYAPIPLKVKKIDGGHTFLPPADIRYSVADFDLQGDDNGSHKHTKLPPADIKDKRRYNLPLQAKPVKIRGKQNVQQARAVLRHRAQVRRGPVRQRVPVYRVPGRQRVPYRGPPAPTVRPPSIPKPVLDLKHIRENPGLYEINCQQRNYSHLSSLAWEIVKLNEQSSEHGRKYVELFQQQKNLVTRIGELEHRKKHALDTEKDEEEVVALKNEGKELKLRTQTAKDFITKTQGKISVLAQQLPNLSSAEVPVGDDPETKEYINVPSDVTPPVIQAKHEKSHLEIGEELDIIDLSSAARMSGWGFYFLKGDGALLEQALVQHALFYATAAAFTPIIPPSLIYQYVASATGYQPRDTNGERQIYEIDDPDASNESKTDDGAYNAPPRMALAGTSEIALAGMFSGQSLPADSLPIKHVAVSRCFRAEAGGRGRDTKGLYRVHEFTKVELFAWTLPDSYTSQPLSSRFDVGSEPTMSPGERLLTDGDHNQEDTIITPVRSGAAWPTPPTTPSQQMLRLMLNLQKSILTPLGLPLRVQLMPTADLGASAALKYDIEAFFPSRTHAPWGELTSLSLCTDYQSRRLATRIAAGSKGSPAQFPYTLNGTAMAVPRVMAAVLEHGWDAERGVVRLPECLWGFMGKREIGPAVRK